MIYYNSKYLSEKLEINLAKWKRWSREFLDPDPLGGYQSGFARQFSFKDAFRVFLGGHLVGMLNYSIPQARQILLDLYPWLKKNLMFAWPKPNDAPVQSCRCVYIFETSGGSGYGYAVRTIVPDAPRSDGLFEEVYSLELIGLSEKGFRTGRFTHARVIDMDALHHQFLNKVDGA